MSAVEVYELEIRVDEEGVVRVVSVSGCCQLSISADDLGQILTAMLKVVLSIEPGADSVTGSVELR